MSPPGQTRGFEEYGKYEYPVSRKMSLDSVLDGDVGWFDEAAFLDSPDYLIRTVAGTGPLLSNEIVYQHEASGRRPLELLADIIRRSKNPGATTWVYSEGPLSLILQENDLARLRRAVISPIELESLRKTHSTQTYSTILDATGAICEELESRALLAKAKAPLMRRLRSRRKRIGIRRNRLLARQRRFNEALGLRKTGQLLAASGADMDRRSATIEVTDYFADRPERRRIHLDGSRTLRENVARMFKQCRKAERGLRVVDRQLEEARTMERLLEDQERQVASIGDWDAWLSRPETAKRASPDQRKVDSQATGARRRRPSVWIDGHEVLVGRSARENDELTFRVATGDDFWLHVADYTGAHVIVRNPGRADRLDEDTLLRAAQLAAYYSQARNSHKVDVHYTRRKFVTKPRKARPGLVRLREFETIAVEPRDWKASEPGPEERLSETPLER